MMKTVFGFRAKPAALLVIYSILIPSMSLGINGQSAKTRTKSLTGDEKVAHVLNRLSFGARPGDVEKVKQIGLQKFIDQQLNPDAINDSALEARVAPLDVFKMSTAQIFAKYPNPAVILRMLDGNGQGNLLAQQNPNQNPPSEADQMKRREAVRELYEKYDFKPAQLLVTQVMANRVLRDTYSERQLQEVMVDFWQNHFNIYVGKNPVRWYIPSYERDVLRKHALGNFRNLVVATAQHPAMLVYLDNFESVSPNAQTAANNPRAEQLRRQIQNGQIPPQFRQRMKQRGLTDAEIDQRIKQMQQGAAAAQRASRGINENYARELMELHTLGVDGGYTQKDVAEVARCFTGWTIADPRGFRQISASMIKGNEEQRYERLQQRFGIPDDVESGEFYFNSRVHDGGEKIVLGQKIKEGGVKDGLNVIDLLVKNPATAKFIARKLAVKFVNDNPSEALVSRIGQAFQKSDGDIKTTLRAIFSDPEFFATENYRAKIKTPFELMVSSLRALNADARASQSLFALMRKLGEVPYGYQAPTGYPDQSEDWVNTGALLERMNFAIALSSNRIPQTRVNLARFEGKSDDEILTKAAAEILQGELSSKTKSILLKQLSQPLPEVKLDEPMEEMDDAAPMGPAGNRRGLGQQARLLPPRGNPEVYKVVGLILGSPDFQRQ